MIFKSETSCYLSNQVTMSTDLSLTHMVHVKIPSILMNNGHPSFVCNPFIVSSRLKIFSFCVFYITTCLCKLPNPLLPFCPSVYPSRPVTLYPHVPHSPSVGLSCSILSCEWKNNVHVSQRSYVWRPFWEVVNLGT